MSRYTAKQRIQCILNNIEYGRMSGIPDCCILYFITKWHSKGKWKKFAGEANHHSKPGSEYVQCDECFRSPKPTAKIIECKFGNGELNAPYDIESILEADSNYIESLGLERVIEILKERLA